MCPPKCVIAGYGRPMDVSPHDKLAALGLSLPEVSPPKGSYVPAVHVGTTVYVSGQVPMVDGEVLATGKVGDEVSVEEAWELSRRCALAALAAIDSITGLENVVRVIKVTGFVASALGFTDQPRVLNGASDLFLEIFGAAGRHARTVVGVFQLPLDAPVEIETIVETRTSPAA
jgi:enamine deaminase RidA (YjgF/YER057c/UK114 family)